MVSLLTDEVIIHWHSQALWHLIKHIRKKEYGNMGIWQFMSRPFEAEQGFITVVGIFITLILLNIFCLIMEIYTPKNPMIIIINHKKKLLY